MPQRRSHVAPSAAQTELAAALAALRESLDAPTDFPAAVVAEAEATRTTTPELDLRDIPFATLDPLGSRDLDQAFHLERRESGYTVRYAIADVPGFVTPGGEVDAEARVEVRRCMRQMAESLCIRRCSARIARRCWPTWTAPHSSGLSPSILRESSKSSGSSGL